MTSPINEQIKEKIYKAVCSVAGLCVPAKEIQLEHPELEQYGDYSTNVAMVMHKDVKDRYRSPRELAQKIVDAIQVDIMIQKVEVAGGGFINIYLNQEWLVSQVGKLEEPHDPNGKTMVIDYSSPNIAKPFGIGHLRSTVIGQALYNLYKFMGYKSIGDNHLGDWGTQFGKLLFMIDSRHETDLSIENLERLYVEFHQHKEWEDEGRKWFAKLEQGDSKAREIWKKCVDASMKEFDRIYDLLGVNIDYAYGESFYEKLMPEVVAEAKEKKIAYLSEGAWVIDVEGFKTPLMLLKSDSGTTYATRDLAGLKFRGKTWDPDIVIYEVGAEQALYFAQLFAAAKRLGYIRPETELVHTKHGLYLDTDGKKFSTRKGKTIKLEEVLQDAIDRAAKLGSKESSQVVGIGAIKYFDLLHNVQSDIVFDWEKVMALQGNSGPYLQYTYARCRSVERKSHLTPNLSPASGEGHYANLNPEELAVVRYLYRFGEVVEEAANRYAPNLVCNYLYELAQRFNTFYNKCSILSAQYSGEREFRLKLTEAVGGTVKKGLNLLGIETLERM